MAEDWTVGASQRQSYRDLQRDPLRLGWSTDLHVQGRELLKASKEPPGVEAGL